MVEKSKTTAKYDPENYTISENDEVFMSYLAETLFARQETEMGKNAGKWNLEWTIHAYITLTDRLVGKFGGHLNKLPEKVPDTVIYLDKSARPVSWLVDALWDRLADEGAKKPDTDFLNIDRKYWWEVVGDSMTGENNKNPLDFDVDKVDPDLIARIRAYFVVGDITEEDYKDKVWDMPTRLDGQHVLIIDEVKSSGATTHIAKALLRKAIPEATFDSEYFWEGPFREGEVLPIIAADGRQEVSYQMYNQPFWYDKNSARGRGVSDPDLSRIPKTPENIKRRISHNVQSITPEDTGRDLDPETKSVQQGIAMLSYMDVEHWILPIDEGRFEKMKTELGMAGLKAHNLRINSNNKRISQYSSYTPRR